MEYHQNKKDKKKGPKGIDKLYAGTRGYTMIYENGKWKKYYFNKLKKRRT